jgi:CRP/FNR family cyclic AMP-dependent transcriptional regulator
MPEQKVANRVGLLSSLSESDTQALLAGAKRLVFRKDENILIQGQSNASLFILVEGLLHVVRTVSGKQVLLGRLEPGAFFGELSLFDPGPTTAAVHAAEDGVLMEISRACLDTFVAQHPTAGIDLLRRLLHDVAHRLRTADERLTESVVWGGLLRGAR